MDYPSFLTKQESFSNFSRFPETPPEEPNIKIKDKLDKTITVKRKSKFDSNFENQEFSANPFSPDLKSSDFFLKSSEKVLNAKKNSNLQSKNLPFLLDFKVKQESDDTWASSDSKILNKMNENSSKLDRYIERFNDSNLRLKHFN
jgi:hypothetical protein